jgi:hypothetical protein
MNNLSPLKKLKALGFTQALTITSFPTFIIEHHLPLLREITEPLLALAELKRKISISTPKKPFDQKMLLDTIDCFNFLSQNAQKVLIYYPKRVKIWVKKVWW